MEQIIPKLPNLHISKLKTSALLFVLFANERVRGGECAGVRVGGVRVCGCASVQVCKCAVCASACVRVCVRCKGRSCFASRASSLDMCTRSYL